MTATDGDPAAASAASNPQDTPPKSSESTMATAESEPEAQLADPLDDLGLPNSAADGVITKPFPKPLEGVRPEPPAQLTPEQNSKYEQVLKEVSAWTTVPVSLAKGAEETPMTDDDRIFLTRECLLRYLRATKWNVAEAVKRLRNTLAWRRDYIGDKLTPEYISIENETGKQVLLGYDIQGRPCHYLIPSNQNTKTSPRQIQHLVFMLERVIELMPPGQESLTLVIDFNQTKNGQNSTIGQAKQTLDFLQNHYPERLGRALVINIPWYINAFLKVIWPFIDPVTQKKLIFNDDLRKHVPPQQLMADVGGDVKFEYRHSDYWPALNKLAERRREAYRQRWIARGKKIGESEFYLRGGEERATTATTAPTGEQQLEEKLGNLTVDNDKPAETAPTAAAS